ncbi:pyruvate formate lyase activating enzyme [Sporobacter termitidis DSM 10068]|uniref:Pyruvate formate lyase activating enzyme n=1 Tax=Sporobacter termitidis DSM 10068 TaxID=1123282 RepID=A0A1M5Z0L4_9FIRM|nr:glycyl-radical enzyme activating protein [Sporobacter termitidis]SHI17816.1 pyruvate formate lyase activating enzyme [Sporobacter termitidis DSM 10068]
MGDVKRALITNIQGYSIHDGPGIRTVVFFKGCSLGCAWCANPETISPQPQIGFIGNLCARCGKCLEACPENAVSMDEGKHRVDDSSCTACGKCVDACLYGALVRYGREMTVEEVFAAVRRDRMFYEPDGGVTASGGEPLLRAPFVRALFELCRADGIGTCVETSGCAAPEQLLEVLPVTGHVLFDLKLMDPGKHRQYTRQSNEMILQNARLAAAAGADILFRVPLIPTVNDDEGNIRQTAEFVKSVLKQPAVQLMPYHRLGDSKYRALNAPNRLAALEVMAPERLEAVRRAFIAEGVDCTISR